MRNRDQPNRVVPGEDDFVLVERVLGGDRRAFEPLVRRHERRVFRVTLAIPGNIEDAEESMQDTFVKAFQHLADFRREARFTSWPAFAKVESDEHIWDLALYVRTFAAANKPSN